MLLIESSMVRKYYGERFILSMDELSIHFGDRIGIVGRNGAGKTTLLNILSKRIEPEEGRVNVFGRIGYITQLEKPDCDCISEEMASKFQVKTVWDDWMSGGEKTRYKIAGAFDANSQILFADEPTSNMDIEGIELLTKRLEEYQGALLVISHDRSFLDRLCNRILEIEDGHVDSYPGNYSAYHSQKENKKKRQLFEYEEYEKEKRRLEKVVQDKKQDVQKMKKTPSRMGNSEARLHKMGPQKAKANMERAIKNVDKRIEHLEVKERPREKPGIKLKIMDSIPLYSKIIMEGKQLKKAYQDKVIFQNAEFSIENGSRVALLGPNGCGKSTLFRMIIEQEDGIKLSKSAKIGYFSQDMNILKKNESILENVMESSIYPKNLARLLLARLLFRGDDIYKKVEVLSGGEQVKVSFAKILLQDINLLLLDEPTNYLDIDALEVIEDTLREYERTLLFVSHDQSFIQAVADHIMTIDNKQIKMFHGNYKEFLGFEKNQASSQKQTDQNKKMLLKNRLADIIGRLSSPSKGDNREELDREYFAILEELKQQKE